MESIINKFSKRFQLIAAYIICGIFGFSAISKILDWSNTVKSMQSILLNPKSGYFTAIIVIFIELCLFLTIFNNRLWKFAGVFSVFILILFTTTALLAKYSGRITECPCFGSFFGAEIGIKLIIRNFILICLSLIWSGLLFKNLVWRDQNES